MQALPVGAGEGRMNREDLLNKYRAFAGRPRVPIDHFIIESFEQIPGIGEPLVEPFMATSIMPKIHELFPKERKSDFAVDLGCGYGNLTIMLAEIFAFVTGVDQCENKIRWARSRWTDSTMGFHHLDITSPDLHFTNADLVLSSTVLQHLNLEDTILVLQNIHRMLIPGGYYVASEGRITREDHPDPMSMRQNHMFAKPLGLWEDLGFRLISIEGQLHVWVKEGK
jgi:SAM-dependent methyltransferase